MYTRVILMRYRDVDVVWRDPRVSMGQARRDREGLGAGWMKTFLGDILLGTAKDPGVERYDVL